MKRLLKHDFYRFCATLLLAFSLLVASFSENIELLFAAAPTITTGSATSITQTTAVLHGNISNNGGKGISAGGFNYGTTASYGSTVSDEVPYTFASEVGTSATGPSQFWFSYSNTVSGGIAIDSSDNIYVTDMAHEALDGRIQVFDTSGTYLSEFGNCDSGVDNDEACSPRGIAIDSDDNIIVTLSEGDDTAGSWIIEYDSTRSFVRHIGLPGDTSHAEGVVQYPSDAAIDSTGAVYIVDGDGRVQKFDANGNFLYMFGWGVATGASQFEICTSACQAGILGSGNGQFDNNADVVVDASNNVYVVDSNNSRVQKFDSAGNYISQFGTAGSGDGQFTNPRGMAIDSSGNLYVVDSGNNRVQKFDSSGVYVSQFGTTGSGNGQFDSPYSIAFDSSGNIYVSDINNNRIQKFNSSGVYILQFGSDGLGNGELFTPTALGIDSSNNLYVSEFGNTRTQKFNSSGTYVNQFAFYGPNLDIDSSGNIYATASDAYFSKYNSSGVFQSSIGTSGSAEGEFSLIYDVDIDASNNFYLTDNIWRRVQKLNSGGSFLGMFGWGVDTGASQFETCTSGCEYSVESGNAAGQFDVPAGIFTDSAGSIYVLENTNNERIQKFNSSFAFQFAFGSSGSGDGQFDEPTDLGVDSIGNIYVVDKGNDRVQKFNSSGIFKEEIGSSGKDEGEFRSPEDIVIDSTDNLYISDSTNNNLQKFTQSSFSATITGLNCGTVYHFQAFATNADGTTNGSDGTFTTSSCGSTGGGGSNPNPKACNDNVDNDGDGFTDYPNDPNCTSTSDDDESGLLPQCADGIDNDGDGDIDVAEDGDCEDQFDDSEGVPLPECRDGIDNDGDGLIDVGQDPDCENKGDDSEAGGVFECNDGIDNDGDGFIDFGGVSLVSASSGRGSSDSYDVSSVFGLSFVFSLIGVDNTSTLLVFESAIDPAPSVDPSGTGDQDCTGPFDDNESSMIDPGALACSDGADNDGDGLIDFPNDPGCTSFGDDDEANTTVVPIFGCTDNTAINYSSSADTDDGSCIFDNGGGGCVGPGCIPPIEPPPPPPPPWWPPTVPVPPTIGYVTETIHDVFEWAYGNIPEDAKKTLPVAGLAIPLAFLIFRRGALLQTGILLSRFWSAFPTLIGLRRKERPWGTVYDSVTKQPLDPVHVTLMNEMGQEVATSITDLDGRYGFLVKPGTYSITLGKDNYVFPSEKMKGKTKDVLYDNLYFGGPIVVEREDDIIVKNIPMDAVNFNWNEFEKSKNKKLMKFFSKTDIWLARVATLFFMLGFVISIFAVVYDKTLFNILIFCFYILLLVLRIFGVRPVAPGTIAKTKSGDPVSFGIVRIFSKALNREIAHSVTSKTGKYYTLIPKGEYYVKIEEKTGEDSYQEAYESDPFSAKKGFIDKSFWV